MFPWAFTFELICFLSALIFLNFRSKIGHWHAFIFYLLFIVALEGTGWTLWFIFHLPNYWLYNIELLVTFLFITWFFYKELPKSRFLNIVFIFGLSVFFASFILETFQTKFIEYNKDTATVRLIAFLIASGYYYYVLLKDPQYLNLYKHASFWIVTGIFFFYFTSTTATLFTKELAILFLKKVPLRDIVYTLINAILYGCWIYAFRCKSNQAIS